MALFVKTETFNKKTKQLTKEKRSEYISMHKKWVKDLSLSGIYIYSGYLIDKNGLPGGGGLLILESESFLKAQSIIITDPMILNKLVRWKLQELITIHNNINHLG